MNIIDERMRKAIQPDGSLRITGSGYISWDAGDDEISLDGHYTVEQLEFIVAHVKSKQAEDGRNATVKTKNHAR